VRYYCTFLPSRVYAEFGVDLHEGRQELQWETFTNGQRLSPEGLQSEPYKLKSDDIVVCIHLFLTCEILLLIDSVRNSESISSG
jgi:hypothetical protein